MGLVEQSLVVGLLALTAGVSMFVLSVRPSKPGSLRYVAAFALCIAGFICMLAGMLLLLYGAWVWAEDQLGIVGQSLVVGLPVLVLGAVLVSAGAVRCGPDWPLVVGPGLVAVIGGVLLLLFAVWVWAEDPLGTVGQSLVVGLPVLVLGAVLVSAGAARRRPDSLHNTGSDVMIWLGVIAAVGGAVMLLVGVWVWAGDLAFAGAGT